MTVRPEFYSFRDALTAGTVRDLIGPLHGDEVRPDERIIDEPPLQRYIAGMLFPRSSGFIDPSLDVDDQDDEDGAHSDPPISLASVRYPSAMGCSFAVDKGMARMAKKARLPTKTCDPSASTHSNPCPAALTNEPTGINDNCLLVAYAVMALAK